MSGQAWEPLPLARYDVSRPVGAGETRAALRGAFGWNVMDVTGDVDLQVRVHSHALRDVLLGCLEFGSDVRLSFRAGKGTSAVVVPLGGTAEMSAGAEEVALAPGRAVVVTDTDPVSMHPGMDFRMSVLQAEQPVLETVLSGMIRGPLREPLKLERLVDLHGGHGLSWHRLWRYVLAELDRPGALIEDPGRAQHLVQELLDMLLYVHKHNYVSRLAGPGALGAHGQHRTDLRRVASYPAYLRKALELIEEHPEWDHRTKSLARYVSISERMLQMSFKEFLGVTPKVHLRSVRLDRVYESLLEASPYDTSIDQVVRRWGFHHHGHFAAAYQERFNERPMATLRRSLGAAERGRVPGQRSGRADDRTVQRQDPK